MGAKEVAAGLSWLESMTLRAIAEGRVTCPANRRGSEVWFVDSDTPQEREVGDHVYNLCRRDLAGFDVSRVVLTGEGQVVYRALLASQPTPRDAVPRDADEVR